MKVKDREKQDSADLREAISSLDACLENVLMSARRHINANCCAKDAAKHAIQARKYLVDLDISGYDVGRIGYAERLIALACGSAGLAIANLYCLLHIGKGDDEMSDDVQDAEECLVQVFDELDIDRKLTLEGGAARDKGQDDLAENEANHVQ